MRPPSACQAGHGVRPGVRGIVSTRLQRLGLHLEIHLGVAVGRLERRVAQPGADRVDVDTGAQEVDGHSMAQGVWADALAAQGGHGLGGLPCGAHDEPVDAEAGGRAAVDVEEDRRLWRAVEARSEQFAQYLGGVWPERAGADLASLAVEAHGADVGGEVRHGDAGGFGGTRAGVVEEQQQRVVAPALRAGPVGTPSMASISCLSRYAMAGTAVRRVGMAWTAAACSTSSGACRAMDRNKERSAANRRLRVEVALPRSCSRWARKPRTTVALTCSTVTRAGSVACCSAM